MVKYYSVGLNLVLFYNNKTYYSICYLFFRKNKGCLPNNRFNIGDLVNVRLDDYLTDFFGIWRQIYLDKNLDNIGALDKVYLQLRYL